MENFVSGSDEVEINVLSMLRQRADRDCLLGSPFEAFIVDSLLCGEEHGNRGEHELLLVYITVQMGIETSW